MQLGKASFALQLIYLQRRLHLDYDNGHIIMRLDLAHKRRNFSLHILQHGFSIDLRAGLDGPLQALKAKSERFALKGKVFYIHTPDGFGTSKLAARAERLLGVEATARNWRTVTTLLELANVSG